MKKVNLNPHNGGKNILFACHLAVAKARRSVRIRRMTDELTGDWRSNEQRETDVAQANALREQASKGGITFETYLTPRIAEWVLDLVAKGVFTSPSDAVFWLMQEQKELSAHADLRKELFNRKIKAALNDPRPGIPAEEVEARMKKRRSEPLPEPAVWQKQKYE